MNLSPIRILILLFIGFLLLKLVSRLVSVTESVVGTVVGTVTQVDIAKKKKLSSILNKLSTICLIGIACTILYFILIRRIPNSKIESIPLSNSPNSSISSIDELPY